MFRTLQRIIWALFIAIFMAFKPLPKEMDPCLKQVDNIFKKMYTTLPKNNRVVFVNYQLVTVLRAQSKQEKEEVNTTDIKIYSGEKQYRFFSKDIIVYQDEKYTFTIIPSKRIVYWANAALDKNIQRRLTTAQNLQDTLFHNYEKVNCKTIEQDGKTCKLVTLIPNKNWASLTQVAYIDFYLSADGTQVLKEKMVYTTAKKMKSVEYIFNEVNYDYKKIDLKNSAQSNVLQSSSKLLPAYAGYQLIDVRNQKKN